MQLLQLRTVCNGSRGGAISGHNPFLSAVLIVIAISRWYIFHVLRHYTPDALPFVMFFGGRGLARRYILQATEPPAAKDF